MESNTISYSVKLIAIFKKCKYLKASLFMFSTRHDTKFFDFFINKQQRKNLIKYFVTKSGRTLCCYQAETIWKMLNSLDVPAVKPNFRKIWIKSYHLALVRQQKMGDCHWFEGFKVRCVKPLVSYLIHHNLFFYNIPFFDTFVYRESNL